MGWEPVVWQVPAFAATPLQPYGAAVVVCEKEVLGDYVGSPVMLPSATKRRWVYCATRNQ